MILSQISLVIDIGFLNGLDVCCAEPAGPQMRDLSHHPLANNI